MLPRNDAGNFRIPYRDPRVKLGMTENLEFLGINLEFLEIAPSTLLLRNDGIPTMTEFRNDEFREF